MEKSGDLILLHPLVLINIGDHLTRTRVSSPSSSPLPPIAGALLGTSVATAVELHTSFDIPFTSSSSIDLSYFDEKSSALKQVLPDYICLGWYHYTDSISTPPPVYQDLLSRLDRDPIVVSFCPNAGLDLPVVVWQYHTESGQFQKVKFEVETGDAERIAMEGVADVFAAKSESQASATANLMRQQSALFILKERVAKIVEYLRKMQETGQTPPPDLLRHIAALSHRLSSLDPSQHQSDFEPVLNDARLVICMAKVTEGAVEMSRAVEHFSTAYDRVLRRKLSMR